MINPTKEKMQIKGVRKLKEGGIIVETSTEADLQMILNSKVLQENGYKTERAGTMNPRVVVYYVPLELSPQEIVEATWAQNKNMLSEYEKDDFENEFKLLFKVGQRREEFINWIAEVFPKLRTVLRNTDLKRLFIGWGDCKVEDFISVTKYFKCQLYGHVQKFCPEEERICGYCSKIGHKVVECPEKLSKKPPACPACKKGKKRSDYVSNAKNCPAYKTALDRKLSRTNYGNGV